MKKLSIRKSSVEGNGLFVDEPVKRGEIIQRINGKKVRKRPKTPADAKKIMNWIGVGKETWINTTGTPFRHINHSCDPNVAIIGTKTVIALRPIRANEELLLDYSMTDGDPLWSMECNCGAKNCRKIISCIQTVTPTAFTRHMPHITRNFQRIYLKHYITSSNSEKKQLLKK